MDKSHEHHGHDRFHRLKESAPFVFQTLRSANSVERARERIFRYIYQLDREYHEDNMGLHPLEQSNAIECLQVFKNTLSKRNERLTGEMPLKYLWMIAHDDPKISETQIAQGFIEEFVHIFRGMHGNSGLYSTKSIPEFVKHEGRKAALLRSENLDEISSWANSYLKKYKSGLDKEIIELRKQNVRRILNYFGATRNDWTQWRWHMKHTIKDAETLSKLLHVSSDDKKAVELSTEKHIPFGITPYYLSLMLPQSDTTDDLSIRAQVIPPLDYVEYMGAHRDEYSTDCDFMLERDTSPIDLVTRRYPKIAIFKPYNTCPQICVYCQRNWEIEEVNAQGALAPREKIDEAIEWFSVNPEVTEVLITGGDPLSLANTHLEYYLKRFSEMPHIERIRIGSRTLVTMPQRITPNLVNMLKRSHNPSRREIVIVTHFQHVSEITPMVVDAVSRLREAGISVYNQQVYTFFVSRRFESMALRVLLKRIGIDPYYTFNTKGKEEMSRYRVPIARLLQERREETRLFPGMTRLDEPVYNVPGLGKNYLKAWQNHEVIMISKRGTRFYEFHPWEKNINPANTYITEDVSIYRYLQELKKIGESPRDYNTIWYYY